MPIYTVQGQILDATGAPLAGVPIRVHSRGSGAVLATAVSSDGATITPDPFWPNVVLLNTFDAGLLLDQSPSAHTLTRNGSGGLTGPGATGSAFRNNGVYTAADHADFGMTGDYTFEAEVFINSWSPGMQGLFGVRDYGNFMLRLQSGLIEVWGPGQRNVIVPGGITTNTWHHIALTRQSGVVRLWFNGVQLDGGAAGSAAVGRGQLMVGGAIHTPGSEYINGFVDNVRVTKGVARYTADFARPITPPLVGDTPVTPAVGSFSIPLSSADPGEVQVVFRDPDGGVVQNDVIQRAVPVAL